MLTVEWYLLLLFLVYSLSYGLRYFISQINMKRTTLKTAKLATEKGYRDNPWEEDYHKTPYQVELQDWLRNVYHIHIYTDVEYLEREKLNAGIVPNYFVCGSSTKDGSDVFYDKEFNNSFNTHEEALEAGLQEALKLIKLCDFEDYYDDDFEDETDIYVEGDRFCN